MADLDQDIIITRPMVGVSEDMGHLPGSLEEKFGPWTQPVFEVLNERLGKSHVEGKAKAGHIRAIPLMFMRGMSLKNSFIIADEMQNATPEQFLMLITRLGEGSTLVIDGDVRQSDLKDKRGTNMKNGLQDALERLQGIPEIAVVEFALSDIVRHGLTRKVLERYDS